MVSRLTILIASFTLAYGFLVFHLYQLQVEQGQHYFVRAASLHGLGSLEERRGTIYFTDKFGKREPAVSNKDFPTVYAVPKTIEEPARAAALIAPLFKRSVSDLTERFSNKKDVYELLGKKVPDETVTAVQALGLKGVYVDTVSERFYPFGKLAAHLLGYVGPSKDEFGSSGHYGIEEHYDKTLRGEGMTEGESIQLTIDPKIQLEAERIMQTLVTSKRAKGGSVLVQDPTSGKVLAMASFPTFDPNNYKGTSLTTFLNPVTQEIYEPGSVFKVITMAAGIDAGKITPNTTFNDPGVLHVNGEKIFNWDLKAYGLVTMTNVIEHSLNTGAAFAEQRTGHETFTSYLKRFGFNEKTGIDLLGESKGTIQSLLKKDSPEIAFATASFGQGIAVSTMEIANAFSAIANGGTLMRPFLNVERGPEKVRTVVSASTARQVTDMMVSALEKAEIAKINGYSLAGKTGTAQVADLVHGGYTEEVINTYAGFGPTSAPRFVIVIKLNEPEGAPLAGTTVVPAFRDLAQFILNYYNIPPDKL